MYSVSFHNFSYPLPSHFPKITPKYFIIFGAIVNGIVFLFLIAHYVELQVTHMLILYPATLLSSFINSHSFPCVCGNSKGFLHIRSYHVGTEKIFHLFLFGYFYFSFITALVIQLLG